ncbi:MAG: Rrf2 family transcriptional regulator [Planctomycetota bacterium]
MSKGPDKMKLTKTSVHAALAVTFLADRPDDRPTQARQVGEHLGVPTDSALKVLQALVRQNLLRSQLGRSGGYRLHTDPADISLLQIIEAIDGPIQAEVPGDGFADEASDHAVNALQAACDRSVHFLRSQLSAVTVADLIDDASSEHGWALAG